MFSQESKQFYLTKAKELKENFTSIFPTYVYKRRPNNSRKRRKTEDLQSYIGRGEGGLSEDEPDSPPPSPGARRPGDPTGMHSMGPPPSGHELSNPYTLHPSQYSNTGRSQSHAMYYDSGSRGPHPGSAPGPHSGGGLWPPPDAKREPKSPRMNNNNNQNSSALRIPSGPPNPSNGSLRNGTGQSSGGGSSYGYNIPSPNFGPAPGLPPIGVGRGSNQQGQSSSSNTPSASHTPLLTPSIPGSMLPPPTNQGTSTTSANSSWMGGLSNYGSSGSTGGSHHGHSTHGSSGNNTYYDHSWSGRAMPGSSGSAPPNGPNAPSGGGTSNGRATPTGSRY